MLSKDHIPLRMKIFESATKFLQLGSQSGEFIHYHFQGCSIHEVTLEAVEEDQIEKDEKKEDEDEDDDGASQLREEEEEEE